MTFMMPHTRGLLALLKERAAEDKAPPGELLELDEPSEHVHADEPFIYQLKLRKKARQLALKRMMTEAGYGDLARMTSIGREHLGDDEP